MKGLTPFISMALTILFVVVAVGIALTEIRPVIQKSQAYTVYTEGIQNLQLLDSAIREVASEAEGSKRTVTISVADGSFSVDADRDLLYFKYKPPVDLKLSGRAGDAWVETGFVDGDWFNNYKEGENASERWNIVSGNWSVVNGMYEGVNGTAYYAVGKQLDGFIVYANLQTKSGLSEVWTEPVDPKYLVGYWSFDEGSGGVAYDWSGHGNNGTLYNFINYNSGFENGWNSSSDSPNFWTHGSTHWSLSLDDSTKIDGKYSLKATTTWTNNGNIAWSWIESHKFNLQPGAKYTISTYMKCENCWGSHIVFYGYNATSDQWYQIRQCPSGQDGNFDWKHWKCAVTIPENVTKGRIVLNAGDSPDGNPSTTWFDNITLTGPNGVYSGWVNGKFGKALSFDGVDDYVETEKIYTPKITVSAWIKIYKYPDEVGDSDNWGVASTGCQGALGGWDLGINPSGHPYFYITYGNDWHYNRTAVLDSDNIEKNKWHFLVGSYDGYDLRIYIDGKMKSETQISGSLQNNNQNLIIGRLVYNPNNFQNGDWTWFNGTIDEVRIYNISLTDSQIKALYEMGLKKLQQSGKIQINSQASPYIVFSNPFGKTYFDNLRIDAKKDKTVYAIIPYKLIDLQGNFRISKGNHQILVENIGTDENGKPIVKLEEL